MNNKETLDTIKQMVAGGALSQEAAEKYFPELAESDDEKIRKECISIIKEYERICIKEGDACEVAPLCIAWLDKQCEQKPIDKIQLGKKYKCIASPRYSTFMKGEIYKPEDKFLCSLMNFCSDCFEPIEDKQKPDKVEPKFKVGDRIIEKSFDECGCGTIKDIKDGKYIFDDGGFINIEEQNLWQLVEQKPVEWSKEDESMIGSIRSIIEKYAFSQSAVDVNGELCEKEFIDADNWLKSLKDRYTWKPSEEQMMCLDCAIKEYQSQGYPAKTLESLYEQLKVL